MFCERSADTRVNQPAVVTQLSAGDGLLCLQAPREPSSAFFTLKGIKKKNQQKWNLLFSSSSTNVNE